MEPWEAIFTTSSCLSSDRMKVDGNSLMPSSSAGQKVMCLADRLKSLMNDPILLFTIYAGSVADQPATGGRKRPTRRFEITGRIDEAVIQDCIRGFQSLAPSEYSVCAELNGSDASLYDDHPIFQVLDVVNELELLAELRVSSLQSLNAARRIAKFLQTNQRLTCLQLGYNLGGWTGLVESAEIIGSALAVNTSLSRVQFLPFSTSASYGVHGEITAMAMDSILNGIRDNASIQSLHLWAPGMIPSSMVRETVVNHPTIVELFLDGETAPWYRGKGVDQYHEFQHLVWKMLSAPTCCLQKLKLHNFHLNTWTVDIFLASLWKGHPLQVLDVSGNFLSSLSFPRYIEHDPEEDSLERNLRLLIVEEQCNTFASLEYDLTYHHDQSRCRQHCHDMMTLLQAKPGLSIQHLKIPAMLQKTRIVTSSGQSAAPVVESSTDHLQFILDHHRIVPPPIRKVDEDFCLALWPLILERCSTLLHHDADEVAELSSGPIVATASEAHSRRRQASVLYQIFQDWSLILLQGRATGRFP